MKKLNLKISAYKLVFISVVFLVIFSFGCAKKDEKKIKIGVVAPLTGPIAVYGENIKNGILLAVEEINNIGGIKGLPINIIIEDEGSGPQAAVNAVNKLITIDHVPAIIGPATSNGVMAAAPVAEGHHVVLFSPSGTSDNIREAGDYVFRNRASASQEASVFAKYIMGDLGLKKFAILRADADYAKSFADVCKKVIAEREGSILFEELFSEGSSDFRSQLAKIKASAPQGLLIIGVPVELGNMLRQIKELGIKAQVFSNTVDNPKIFEFARGAEEGLTFVTTFYDPEHGDEKMKEFDSKFRKKFGKASHIFGANAYDAVYILKNVIENYGYQGPRIRDGLYNVKDFRGAAGIQGFDEKGDLKLTRVAVKKISKGQFVFLKEVQQ